MTADLHDALKFAARYMEQVVAETGFASDGERIGVEQVRAALSKAEATPSTEPDERLPTYERVKEAFPEVFAQTATQGEREELAKHWDEMAAFGKLQYEQCLAAGVERDVARIHLDISAKQERTAALLRTPHGLPVVSADEIGEVALNANTAFDKDGWREDGGKMRRSFYVGRAILSRLSPASREDV